VELSTYSRTLVGNTTHNWEDVAIWGDMLSERENLLNYLFVHLHAREMVWIVEMYGERRRSGSMASATKLPRKRNVFYLLWMSHESRIFKPYYDVAIIMHPSSSFQIGPGMSEGGRCEYA
jgi:hypothetical protein